MVENWEPQFEVYVFMQVIKRPGRRYCATLKRCVIEPSESISEDQESHTLGETLESVRLLYAGRFAMSGCMRLSTASQTFVLPLQPSPYVSWQIVSGGGAEGLILDTAGNLLSSRYRERVSQHEAGHFLVSYLLGVLPRAYTLSSLNALTKYGALNVQAGTRFVDYDFQEEVKTGKLQSKVGGRINADLRAVTEAPCWELNQIRAGKQAGSV
jgi:hypothetical protein